MNFEPASGDKTDDFGNRRYSFGSYRLARDLFDDFWDDSEVLGKDIRGRELARRPFRSLDSVCANIEEGYGRGVRKKLPQDLPITLGEVRESRRRGERCARLWSRETITKRTEGLSRILVGFTKTIRRIESCPNRKP